jgi:hypothetical protein
MTGVVREYLSGRKTARQRTVNRGMRLERAAGEGESPVPEIEGIWWVLILSTTGHEKSCRKQGGPPSKAKYSAATDSA